MKRDVSRVLVLCLFSILLIGFAAAIVSAQTTQPSTTPTSSSLADRLASSGNWLGQNIGYTLQGWQKGNLDAEALKWLYFILIAVLVYSILGTIGLFDSSVVRWVLGAVVAFISTAYITPDQFWAIGQEYSVFGMTLSVFLPFIILFFFTFTAAKDGKADGLLLQWVVWVIFAGFLLVDLLAGTQQGNSGYYELVIFLAALFMVIFNNFFTNTIMKRSVSTTKQAAKRVRDLATSHEKGEAAAEKDLGAGI